MKGDFTRDTFRPTRHFSSVRMQQGRVQMDADWNEAEDIRLNRERIEATDVIGGCGTPANEPGFTITFGGTGFAIGNGRYYVDGILCENEADVDYDAQEDYPGQTDPTTGTQLFYLDVWEEHVTALEDPLIREVALNGPDTATRKRVVWQVKAAALPSGVTTCDAAMATLLGPTDARLQARAKTLDDTEACTVKPGAQYKRLENQLYRIEVHIAGNLANATFKWSRDNGTVVTGFQIADSRTLTADSVGRDQMLSFASGQWIEITDRRRELLAQTGDFFLVSRVEGNKLILDAAGPAVNAANYGDGMKVRRWDSQKDVKFANLDADGYMTLEDGVQVLISGTDFRTGDYWLIPARTVTADVEWPQTGGIPDALPPNGIQHYRCALAIATSISGGWSIVDCRDPFVPLTQVISLYYVAGDGQTATPDPLNLAAFLPLPQNPTVGVARGNLPVANENVRFTIVKGTGQIVGASTVPTNALGLAACQWQLSSVDDVQQLKAELLNSEGQPTGIPILFTATLNKADAVAYTPNCPDLQAVAANTVQKAIDELCKRQGSNGCCKSVGKGGDYQTIEEALKDLLKDESIRGICLCLMPGRNPWAEGFQFPPREEPLHLTLTGIRGASVLVSDGPFGLQGLGVVVLSDLVVEAAGGAFFRELQELDITFTQLEVRKRLEASGIRSIHIQDSSLALEGTALFEGNENIQFDDLVIQVRADGDAIVIVATSRLAIQGCMIDGVLPNFDSALIRLAACRQTVINGNEFRARTRKLEDNTNLPGIGLVANEGVVGEIVGRLGGRLNRNNIAAHARTLLGASVTDRTSRISDLTRFVSENGMRLGADGTEAFLKLSDVLKDPNADEARIGEAIGDIHERIGNDRNDAGALAVANPFGVALVLMDGRGQTRITQNVIYGYVALYGNPGTNRILEPLARQYLARLKQRVGPWGVGMLHFSENDLFSILLADDFGNPNSQTFQDLMQKGTVSIDVFRMMTMSDNTINLPPFEILCSALSFTGNQMNQNIEYAGIVIGHRATYTGNISYGGMALASATEVFAEAANISLGIA